MAITLKDLNAKLTMIKLTAERANIDYFNSGRFRVEELRIQTGPGGKRLIAYGINGIYEITSFMPAKDLNNFLNGLWNGIEWSRG